jgi:hypothetical protein
MIFDKDWIKAMTREQNNMGGVIDEAKAKTKPRTTQKARRNKARVW